ncbi:hypothetical protein PVK06_025920 [Gossypium arboreum]|uniref:Secreted protein n=1 Tax=Gossypium arboreum TaxID=29729 RepID=A0ABR0NWB3_GOSAR|nr:hypothetical protein PVK06_025920 [Gossypium arboreum]
MALVAVSPASSSVPEIPLSFLFTLLSNGFTGVNRVAGIWFVLFSSGSISADEVSPVKEHIQGSTKHLPSMAYQCRTRQGTSQPSLRNS